jgi:hypothetical protein
MTLTAKQKREAREQALREEGAALARQEMRLGPNASIRSGDSEQIQQLNLAAFQNPGAAPAANGPIAKPQSSGAKVTVACKLGVAHYDIQHTRMDQKFEQNLQGGRMVTEGSRDGEVVRLRGTSYPRGTPPKGFPPPPEMMNGAALTRGVDKDWFDEWLRQHRRDPIVINKMIFAAETDDALRGESAELSKFLSGLDPVNPGDDSRIPKSTRIGTGKLPEVGEIESGQK